VSRVSEPLPFLKWAGGKRQLLPQLRRFYPDSLDRYWEPFLGSGAVFFDLVSRGRVRPEQARLSDENADLIGTYLRLRDSTDAVVTMLAALAAEHVQRGRDCYGDVRDARFNTGRTTWLAGGGAPATYPVALAAMFIYLNRTGFNGLFRLNSSGEFNVPPGRYVNPGILNEGRLRSAAQALARTHISRRTFDDALNGVGAGDFVYLDPPYAPLSATANFRSYTSSGFAEADQRRLRDHVVRLASLGARVVLSNSVAPSVVTLYDDTAVRRAGLRCYRVSARRAINSRSDRRGPIEELVVTNVREEPT
jgi:DNA adenine methylase